MSDVIIKVNNKKIKSVEKGNILTTSINPVCAFTVEQDGVDIKLLLFGSEAKVIYDSFLKDGGTKNTTKTSNGCSIYKEVFVSFEAKLKDYKYGQIIVHNHDQLKFNYSYTVV